MAFEIAKMDKCFKVGCEKGRERANRPASCCCGAEIEMAADDVTTMDVGHHDNRRCHEFSQDN